MTASSYQPSSPVDIEVREAAEGHWTLVFVKDFTHALEKVWSALTEPDQSSQWAPYNVNRSAARAGG